MRPLTVVEALPIIIKKVFGGGGLKIPVGIIWTTSSAVSIFEVEALRSRLALPGEALTREVAEGAEYRVAPAVEPRELRSEKVPQTGAAMTGLAAMGKNEGLDCTGCSPRPAGRQRVAGLGPRDSFPCTFPCTGGRGFPSISSTERQAETQCRPGQQRRHREERGFVLPACNAGACRWGQWEAKWPGKPH